MTMMIYVVVSDRGVVYGAYTSREVAERHATSLQECETDGERYDVEPTQLDA